MNYIDITKYNKDVIKIDSLDNLDSVTSILTKDEFISSNNPNYTYYYTTKEYPFTLEKQIYGKTLHINYEYYLEHEDEINLKLANLLKNNKTNGLSLSSYFIDNSIIEAISSNNNILSLNLGVKENYILEKDVYDILSKSKSIKQINTVNVDNDLQTSCDKRLTSRMNTRVGNTSLTVETILTSSIFTINSRDIKDVIQVLKDRDKYQNIYILEIEVTSYDYLEAFIKSLIAFYPKIRIVLDINSKNFREDKLSSLISYNNIFVKEESNQISLEKAIKKEKALNKMLEPVMKIKDRLSPFELYIMIFQITKEFKEYKDYPYDNEDPAKSRVVSEILFNEYIVCAGYVNLLRELCDRVGIETRYMIVSSIIYDKDKKENYVGYHARALVKIKDEKYDIDGIYVSDATWDNTDGSKYNHLLMTFDEVNRELSPEINFNCYDFLNVKSKKEFYQLISNPTIREELKKLGSIIEKFDSNAVESIYFLPQENYYDYDLENSLILDRLADYCVNFKQEPISGEKIIKALITVYKLKYPLTSDEIIIKCFKSIKDKLSKREDMLHPTIVTETDKEKIFDFYDNKFKDVDVEDIFNNRKNTR